MKKLTMCTLAVFSLSSFADTVISDIHEYYTGNVTQGSGEITSEETKDIDPKELAEFREKLKKVDPKDHMKFLREESLKKNVNENFHFRASVNTQDYYILVGNTLPVRAYHTVKLWNPLYGNMEYHVNFNLCVMVSNCRNYPFSVTLEPGKEYRQSYTSQIIQQFHSPGTFPIQGVSNVSGWDGGTGVDNKAVNVSY